MKYVKLIWLASLLVLANQTASGQGGGTGNMQIPAAVPAWQWRCDSGDATLNSNPAMTVGSGQTITFDSIPYASNYTLVVVYKPTVDYESAVWRLTYSDNSIRGLTTEHIISNNTHIRYSDTTTGTPVINTLRQSAPDSTSPTVRLTIGGDSLPGSVKIAEILYFDRRLNNAMLRRVQSALAIRYGITLGPVDYVDGRGDVVWKYADSGQYHHRVTGIGRDSTYRLLQLGSRSEMAGSLLTVRADGFTEGMFFVCGDDDAPLEFVMDGQYEVLSRKWRISSNDTENNRYRLSFDRGVGATDNDSIVLLVDGYASLPDSLTSQDIIFRNVMFSSDTSTFTLARGNCFWQIAASNVTGQNGEKHNSGIATTVESNVYPNPSTGNYTIEVTGAEWVKVSIYDIKGRLVGYFNENGRKQYIFDGKLPTGNTYYATITTESGTQTLKLIVK